MTTDVRTDAVPTVLTSPDLVGMRQRRVWRIVAVLVPVGAALAALGLVALQWPRFWVSIALEQTPMTWLQSVVLVLCAALTAELAATAYITGGRRPALVPGLLACGFAFLALDERFALHERLRDAVLAPAGIRLPLLSWMAPGDFVLLGYALAGLALLPAALRTVPGDRQGRRLFLAGVTLSALAVAADTVDVKSLPLAVERLEQSVEELVELAGGILLLLALLRRRLAPGL